MSKNFRATCAALPTATAVAEKSDRLLTTNGRCTLSVKQNTKPTTIAQSTKPGCPAGCKKDYGRKRSAVEDHHHIGSAVAGIAVFAGIVERHAVGALQPRYAAHHLSGIGVQHFDSRSMRDVESVRFGVGGEVVQPPHRRWSSGSGHCTASAPAQRMAPAKSTRKGRVSAEDCEGSSVSWDLLSSSVSISHSYLNRS